MSDTKHPAEALAVKMYDRAEFAAILSEYGDQDAQECAAMLRRIPVLEAEIAKYKAMPMKYRRMAFNAELQEQAKLLEAERDEARRTVRMAHELGTAVTAERDQLREELTRLRAALEDAQAGESVAQMAAEALRGEISDAIGTTYYMDPPDGGDVPLAGQVRRMSVDAARWRFLRKMVGDGSLDLKTDEARKETT